MKEKPLCGYCYNECTDDCCDKRRVDVLERQLKEAREEFSKLVDHMGYFSQRELANQIGKVHKKLKEQG